MRFSNALDPGHALAATSMSAFRTADQGRVSVGFRLLARLALQVAKDRARIDAQILSRLGAIAVVPL
jgi:hypothetical protein